MRLHKILTYAGFLCLLVGTAGFAGTVELEPVDRGGVVAAVCLIVIGVLCGVWAALEEGGHRRRTSHRK